ncbi:helix-turn-helix domain-containing protein [Rathayibacter sp. AY1B8]|uniref:helix-turn-helix domain-containing protein n=1 Tax=Rathayibacter sp. AY1B8 TaxID=2080533 RepID=UPI000CE73CEE|nr:helix-turn-helix transcriptional regulator [Rathayibacter sp. AY1B8]PPI08213.1 hypothetical protein C5C63_04470 [Rathayibacter sp. AY1B8]
MTNSSVHDYTRQTAAILRGLVARYGVTQAELSAAVGVSQSQLSKMLRGQRPIDIDQLEGMARALGTSGFAVLKEVEDTLADFDVTPATALIFVEEGLRLPEPFDTTGWGSSPVVEPYGTVRKRTGAEG